MCNKFIFLLILIFGLVCVGGVSANDQLSLNTTDVNTDSELNTGISSQLSENDGSVVSDGENSVVSNDGVVTEDPAYYDRVSDSGVIVENGQPLSLNDLKDLINSGSGNIELNDDYEYHWLSDMGFDGISINGGNYVINGNNHTIDGGSRVSLFNVNGGSLTLLNINFVNFKGDGAVVCAKDCVLNITQCSLINNTALVETYDPIEKKKMINPLLNSYGVVYLDGVNASIDLSVFSNNVAKYGAAVYARNSNLAFVGNVFSYNVANSFGGAIYSANSRILSSSNAFINNSANCGGAIYFDETSFDSAIIMNNFVNNTASYGGAIYSLTTNSAFVIYSNFMNNTASCGNSINVAKGTMISQGNTFDNESDFAPSLASVCGNCIFMNIEVQNTTKADNTTVPMVHLVEAMRVNPECIRYNTNSYIAENYYRENLPASIKENVEYLFKLKNQTGDVFTLTSFMNNIIDVEKELMAYVLECNYTYSFSVVMDVCNDDDLENAITVAQYAQFYNPRLDSFTKVGALVLNFEKNHVFNFNTRSDGSVFTVNVGNLILNGDNTTFKVVNHYDRDEFHFMYINSNSMVTLSSLIISGFNTAIENHGVLFILSTNFTGNRLDYIIDQDYGGAIKNFGYVCGQNCSFEDNYAKKGGAIYNRGYVDLVNCSFSNNKGYGVGDDIYNFDTGVSNLTNVTGTVVNEEGLSELTKILLRVGAVTLIIVAATFICAAPMVSVAASFGLCVLSGLCGAGIMAAEFAFEGYCDQNMNLKQILIGAAIGFGIGFLAGITACSLQNCYPVVTYDAYYSPVRAIVGACILEGLFGGGAGLLTYFNSPNNNTNITTGNSKISDVLDI